MGNDGSMVRLLLLGIIVFACAVWSVIGLITQTQRTPNLVVLVYRGEPFGASVS